LVLFWQVFKVCAETPDTDDEVWEKLRVFKGLEEYFGVEDINLDLHNAFHDN